MAQKRENRGSPAHSCRDERERPGQPGETEVKTSRPELCTRTGNGMGPGGPGGRAWQGLGPLVPHPGCLSHSP